MQPRINILSDIEVMGDFFFYPLNHIDEDLQILKWYMVAIYKKYIDRVVKAIKGDMTKATIIEINYAGSDVDRDIS